MFWIHDRPCPQRLEYMWSFAYKITMFKNLLKESIHEMHSDVKIIRLTFLTSFFHSLIVIFMLILNLNDLLARHYENGLYIGKVAEYFVQEIHKNHVLTIVIVITIVIFLAYSIIYPLWQAALIHYIKDRQGIRKSLKKWWNDFFPMFEFSFISLVTSPTVRFLVLLRCIILGTLFTGIIFWSMLLRIIAISIFNALKAHTRYFISLEWLPLYESFKLSFQIGRSDLRTALKYMRVQTILLINFSINLFVIAGLPCLLIYLSISFDMIHYTIVKIIIYFIFALLVIVGSYMSSFIRAFFAYYRYKLYLHVRKK